MQHRPVGRRVRQVAGDVRERVAGVRRLEHVAGADLARVLADRARERPAPPVAGQRHVDGARVGRVHPDRGDVAAREALRRRRCASRRRCPVAPGLLPPTFVASPFAERRALGDRVAEAAEADVGGARAALCRRRVRWANVPVSVVGAGGGEVDDADDVVARRRVRDLARLLARWCSPLAEEPTCGQRRRRRSCGRRRGPSRRSSPPTRRRRSSAASPSLAPIVNGVVVVGAGRRTCRSAGRRRRAEVLAARDRVLAAGVRRSPPSSVPVRRAGWPSARRVSTAESWLSGSVGRATRARVARGASAVPRS